MVKHVEMKNRATRPNELDASGTIYELSPTGGVWNFTTIYRVSICNPYAGVTMDTAGNLYGVCAVGGAYGYGFVFKLTNSGGSWSLADLHDFDGCIDGAYPQGGVALDNRGNLYGTTRLSICNNSGTVWEITGLSGSH